MHKSSYDKMEHFRDEYLGGLKQSELRIFDLGSADINGSYQPIFDQPNWNYCGIDMAEGKNVHLVLKNPNWWREIPSGHVDVLISGQALEHMPYVWIVMLEIARVLKPGGLCCLIAPAGGIEHRFPLDCWRFYPDGFETLAKFARLKILEVSTQWEPDPKYADCVNRSNIWQDTMMVCQKPHVNIFQYRRDQIRRRILHKVMLVLK